MREPYWSDKHATLYLGDALEVLTEMPDKSVDCLITSPPYYGLRDYDVAGQIGQEETPDDYIQALRTVFTEARRVLTDDGTMWINIGDCYAANSDGWRRGKSYNPHQPAVRPRARLAVPPKNLLGIPWKLAFGLQRDSWILRSAIVWNKPNAAPHPVRDRVSNRYEMIFMFVKQRRYWFDLDPIREPYAGDRTLSRRSRKGGRKPNTIDTSWSPEGKYTDGAAVFSGCLPGSNMLPTGRQHTAAHPAGRNPGDVWTISTRPLRSAHFAPFPIDIPLRAGAAGCRPGGTILDPFSGASTTALAARQLGRKFVGIELNESYVQLAVARIRQAEAARGGES